MEGVGGQNNNTKLAFEREKKKKLGKERFGGERVKQFATDLTREGDGLRDKRGCGVR